MFDLSDPSKDFAADFQDLTASVRAREGEFLVGAGGSKGEIFGTVSADISTMDVELVEKWRHRLTHVLDEVGIGEAKL